VHKPLVDTRWTRFKLLIRGLLFYNTIYWRRASDGLNPPKLTLEQRRSLAPPKNLDVIKPRVKPRARLDEIRRQHTMEELSRLRAKMPAAVARNLSDGIPKAPVAPVVPVAPPFPRRSGAGTAASYPTSEPATGAHRRIRPDLDASTRHRRRRTSPRTPRKGFVSSLIARLLRKKKY
jgi:hypothetical protein